MNEPTDDMTTAYMAGFHKRDDEVAALKGRVAELFAACKYAVADMSDFGRVQYKTWDMMTAALRKAGE